LEAWETSGVAVRALEAAAPAGASLRTRRGDAARALDQGRDGLPPDVVLLDPPRAGARTIAEALRDHPARAVIYVSCDPYTLARDLGILGQGGWKVERVIPVDLFPHTPHIEMVTTLRRR
jgi:23S rRNA (uracil1939-C5)-methyltransferase